MPRIDHRRHRRHASKRRSILLYGAAIVFGLFIAANLLTLAVFHNRTYPNTRVIGKPIGNTAFSTLARDIRALYPVPQVINLQHGGSKASAPAADLGIREDASPSVASARQGRSWLPVANFFTKHNLAAPIGIDSNTLQDRAKELDTTFSAAPKDARLLLENGHARIAADTPGYRLDHTRLADAIRTALGQGRTSVAVPVHTTPAARPARSLEPQRQALDRQLGTAITLQAAGKTIQPSRSDIAGWYVASNQLFTVSESNIISYLTKLGLASNARFTNSVSVAAATARALKDSKPLTASLDTAATVKTITYCTATKGVDSTELPALQAKARTTYADARGWSLGGIVAFKEVPSGCDFTLWLSAANLMPTFGAICDSTWSCRVGPNVVINYDRWQHASPAWNEYGGTLDNYRDMVINHETGHWLGFGHDFCPGPGQQAPVMQQQSINLQGCTFSPWPNTGELQTNRRNLGL